MTEFRLCATCQNRLAALNNDTCISCDLDRRLTESNRKLASTVREVETAIGHPVPEDPPDDLSESTLALLKVVNLQASGTHRWESLRHAADDPAAPLDQGERMALVNATPEDHAAAVAVMATVRT